MGSGNCGMTPTAWSTTRLTYVEAAAALTMAERIGRIIATNTRPDIEGWSSCGPRSMCSSSTSRSCWPLLPGLGGIGCEARLCRLRRRLHPRR